MTGSKRFAAFSGSYYCNVGDPAGTVDHILSQLTPVEQHGQKFALIGAPNRLAPLYDYTTVLLYYYTTVLLHYCTTILLYYYTTVLLSLLFCIQYLITVLHSVYILFGDLF